jgi:hypothetical protein
MALVVDTLRGYGYSVSVNEPYIGNELIARHGNPARGIDSIQVEINKSLFMDVKTFRKTAGFAKLKADLDRLFHVLTGDSARRAATREIKVPSLPLARERRGSFNHASKSSARVSRTRGLVLNSPRAPE